MSPRWESESKTGPNHRNRLTPIRLHSAAGISFPSDEISFIFFFFHRSSANFRSSTPLFSPPPPFFFRSRTLQNWIRSNFFISPYPNFKIKIKNKRAYLEIYFSIKKQYHYKRMSNLYQFTCKHGKKVLILFHCIFSERKQFTHLLIT